MSKFKLTDDFERKDNWIDKIISFFVLVFGKVKLGWVIPMIFSTYFKFKSPWLIPVDLFSAYVTVYLIYFYFTH